MTEGPYRDGDFVWTNFPQNESPVRPGPRHIAYVLVALGKNSDPTAMLAYTTSQAWVGQLPWGVRRFDEGQALALGQDKAFVMDLRRIAYVPISAAWFPQINDADRGIVGRASSGLKTAISIESAGIFKKRAEIIQKLGPSWPR